MKRFVGLLLPLALGLVVLAAAVGAGQLASGWVESVSLRAERSGGSWDHAHTVRLLDIAGTAAAFGAMALGTLAAAALLDRRPGRLRRLGLRPSPWGPGGDALFAVAGLFPLHVGATVVQLFPEPSPRLRAFETLAAGAGGPWLTLGLVLVIAIVPALGEELLFRGLLLRHWSRVLPSGVAVVLVTLAFGLVHVDLQQAVGVLPLGLWLAVGALRTGSLRGSMLAHFLANLTSCCLIAWCGARADHIPGWVDVLAWSVAFPAFLGASRLLAGDRARGSCADRMRVDLDRERCS